MSHTTVTISKTKSVCRKSTYAAATMTLAATLAACGSSSSSTTSATTAAAAASSSATSAATTAKHYSLAYVPGVTGIAFYDTLSAGMKAEAAKLGMSYTYQGAAAFSPSAQTPIVDGVCTNKPSALVVSPTDPVAMASAINTCLSAGIPVITTDTTLTDASQITSQITTNNLQGGQLAADFLGQQLKGTGEVAVLSISATATTQVLRAQGFVNEMRAKYPNIKVLPTTVTAQPISASTTAVQSLMLAHPKIKAFFSVSGTGAEGAAAAFSANGSTGKILNVGFDAGPNTVKLLQSGGISATVAQNPTQEGVYAAEYAYDKLTGNLSAIQKTIQLPDVLITSSDANNPSFAKYFYKV